MMEMARQESGAGLRFSRAVRWHGIQALLLRLSHELLSEIQRLNSARLGGGALSQLSPRERPRAVKAALAAHHRGISRCC